MSDVVIRLPAHNFRRERLCSTFTGGRGSQMTGVLWMPTGRVESNGVRERVEQDRYHTMM